MWSILLLLVVVLSAGLTPSAEGQDLEQAAKAAIAAKHFVQARAIYLTLLASHPDNLDYLQGAARVSAWVQDYPSAIRYYDEAISRAPHDADPLIGKAYVMLWQGRLSEANSLLVQAARLSPPNNHDLEAAQLAYRRQAEATHPPPELRKAQAAVRDGRFERARQLYQILHQEFPDELDYLVWMARLAGWSGHYEAAVDEYQAALARAPSNIDILIGEANVCMWQGRYDRSRELIERADAVDPKNAQVELAWATYYHFQDLDAKAAPYVDQLLAREPDNEEAKLLRSELVMPHPWFLTSGYEHDWFTFVTPGNVYSVTLGYDGEKTHGALLYQCWDRFHTVDHRGGLSLDQKLAPRTWLHLQGLWSPGASIIPRQDYSIGVSQGLPWGIALGGDYRYLRFSGINVHIFSPWVEYYFTRPIWLHFAFYETLTEIQGLPSKQQQSYLIQYNQQFGSLIGHVGYAYGNETFSQYTADRVGQFSANTLFGSLDYAVSEQLKLSVFYSFQDRSSSQQQNSFGLSVTLRP